MSVVKENAGEILEKYLDDHGIKQTFVAKKIGMTPANFNSHMRGRLSFSADFAIAVSKALDISAKKFLK